MSGALTDFNDLAVRFGLGEVARQIMAVVNNAPTPQQSANDDIAPADKAIADQQQKDLNAMLQRYAKIMAPGRATNKVYDYSKKLNIPKPSLTTTSATRPSPNFGLRHQLRQSRKMRLSATAMS